MVRITHTQQRLHQGDNRRYDSAVGSDRIWKNSIYDIKRAAENESYTKVNSQTTKTRHNSSLSGQLHENIASAHEPTYHDPLFRSVAYETNSNNLGSTIGTQSPLLRFTVPHHQSCGLIRGSQTMQNHKYMFKSGPARDPVYAENSYCQKLLQFTIKHRLTAPDFVNFHLFDQNQNKIVYMSRVKVDEWSYSSVEFEHFDLNIVQEYAAKKALLDLTKRFAENDDLVNLRTATDERLIANRIAEMVSNHPNGLKAEFVETKFIELFKEKLPTNWIKIVKSHELISVDNLINGFYIYPQKNIDGDILNVSDLPPLILPECEHWNVFLTHCLSSSCVYFRLVGPEYDEKYEALSERMEINYKTKETDLQPAETIVEGCYYVACIDDNFHRVKVLSNDPKEKHCRVSLIDHGEEGEVSKECIFPLDKEFTHLPAQALSCSLAGLEEYRENEYVTHKLKLMAQRNKAYVAKVKSRNPDLVLKLYDTTTDEDVKMNKKILKEFLDLQKLLKSSKVIKVINSGSVRNEVDVKTCSSSTNEKLPSKIPSFPLPSDKKLRVYVSTVLNGGRFIIQPLEYKDELAKMTEEMRKYYSVNKPQADVFEIQVGNEFAFENEKKEWRRGLVIDVLKDMGEVSFKCVDYGNVITVDYRMVCSLMPCFRKTPALAMEAQLARIAPVNSHWSMKDCLHFHDFLVNKAFCAQVIEVVDGVASLKLTYDDVSSGSQIDVGSQFVKEGRAIDTWPEWRR